MAVKQPQPKALAAEHPKPALAVAPSAVRSALKYRVFIEIGTAADEHRAKELMEMVSGRQLEITPVLLSMQPA